MIEDLVLTFSFYANIMLTFCVCLSKIYDQFYSFLDDQQINGDFMRLLLDAYVTKIKYLRKSIVLDHDGLFWFSTSQYAI